MSDKAPATDYPFVSLEDAMKDQTTQAAQRCPCSCVTCHVHEGGPACVHCHPQYTGGAS